MRSRTRSAIARQVASPSSKQRGVSLVEALVSLAVMSFGMLGVVGVQATLRYNAEVSKQRSEAVRIGQQEMESLRSFVQQGIDATGARRAYSDMQSGTSTTALPVATGSNTAFTIERTVNDATAFGFKSARVRVLWTDRSGREESISLNSNIAAMGPDSTADLLRRETVSQPASPVLNRHVSIPLEAQILQSDRTQSIFRPPVDGTNTGTVVWVFNNLTGMIVGQCDIRATASMADLVYWDLTWCSRNANMHLLAGAVRFSIGANAPTSADAESPASPVRNLNVRLDLAGGRSYQCFDDAPTLSTEAAGRTAVNYYCAISASANRLWQGTAMLLPLPFSDQPNVPWHVQDNGLPTGTVIDHLLCRYTPAASESQWVANEQHPRVYGYLDAARQQVQTTPMGNLREQNFLVIRSAHRCPTDGPANPAARDFVNSNTLEHLALPP